MKEEKGKLKTREEEEEELNEENKVKGKRRVEEEEEWGTAGRRVERGIKDEKK